MSLQNPTQAAEPTRQLITSDIDQLAQYHELKNRRYTQIHTGELNAQLHEASLGNAQIFRERLNVGTRIQAAPADIFLPFAYVLPSTRQFRFCGREGAGNSLVQATGGTWEIYFEQSLDYVCSVFNRDYFCSGYEQLTGRVVPKQYLKSQISPPLTQYGQEFAACINNILRWAQRRPGIFHRDSLKRLLCSQLLKLTINALPPVALYGPEKTQPRRIQGARRVIDYLQAHARELPDMQSLCGIANLSERSLQYGFLEYLGVTPIQYLRVVRLNGARIDLLRASGKDTKVADIALNWGFLELGRFSTEYRQLFRERPSMTLRR